MADLAEEVAGRRERLLGSWPVLAPEWWPRSQDRTVIVLANGGVLVEGVVDVALGGPPTPHRAALIEFKWKSVPRKDRDDALFYALLVMLRDEVPPDLVVTCSAIEGLVNGVWIGEGELRAAARRLGDVILRAGELAAGRTPEERAGKRCNWCPDLAVCPTGSGSSDAHDKRVFELLDFAYGNEEDEDEPF